MADAVNPSQRSAAGNIVSFHKELVEGGISEEYAGKIALEFATGAIRGDITFVGAANV